MDAFVASAVPLLVLLVGAGGGVFFLLLPPKNANSVPSDAPVYGLNARGTYGASGVGINGFGS